MDIGEQLLIARTSKGISQAALARSAETTNVTVCTIEKNRGNPTLKTLGRLADALDKKLVIRLDDE